MSHPQPSPKAFLAEQCEAARLLHIIALTLYLLLDDEPLLRSAGYLSNGYLQ